MYSLIITILALVLAVACVAAQANHTGDVYTKSSIALTASAIANQGSSLVNFAGAYYANTGSKPSDITTLVAEHYLSAAPTLSLNGTTASWTQPLAKQVVYELSSPLNQTTCQALNQQVRGDSGILKAVLTTVPVQCLWNGNYTVVAGDKDGLSSYAQQKGLSTLNSAPLTTTDTNWQIAPPILASSEGADTSTSAKTPKSQAYTCAIGNGFGLGTSVLEANNPHPYLDLIIKGENTYLTFLYKTYQWLGGYPFATLTANGDTLTIDNVSTQQTLDAGGPGSELGATVMSGFEHLTPGPLTITVHGANGASVDCNFLVVSALSDLAPYQSDTPLQLTLDKTTLPPTGGEVIATATSGHFVLGPKGELPVVSITGYNVPSSNITMLDNTHIKFIAPDFSSNPRIRGAGMRDYSTGDSSFPVYISNYMDGPIRGVVPRLTYLGLEPFKPTLTTQMYVTIPQYTTNASVFMVDITPGAGNKLWGLNTSPSDVVGLIAPQHYWSLFTSHSDTGPAGPMTGSDPIPPLSAESSYNYSLVGQPILVQYWFYNTDTGIEVMLPANPHPEKGWCVQWELLPGFFSAERDEVAMYVSGKNYHGIATPGNCQ